MRDQIFQVSGDERIKTSIREKLHAYLTKWPLFLISLFLCLGVGMLYIRYSIPQYLATTAFIVKSEQSATGSSSNDLIQEALSGKREVNLNNEMLLIGSTSLMQQNVAKYGFNINYFRKGRLLNIEIYKDAPFLLVGKNVSDSNRTYHFFLKNIDIFGGTFTYGVEKSQQLYPFRWGKPFLVDGQQFVLEAKRQIRTRDGGFIVEWKSITAAAAEYSKSLTIKPYDSKTTVIQLTIKTGNLEKGKDLLNRLFGEYNYSEIDDRIKLSNNTVQFIDERLMTISGELKGVEGRLENYQGTNQLVDIKSQSTQSLENSSDVLKTIKTIGIQRSVASMIQNYFNNPVSGNKLVPSSMGLNDPTLTSLITQFNDIQLKKEREAPLVAPNSTVMQDLNTQTGSLRASIMESLNNLDKNLRIQEISFQEQNSRYRSFLSAIPHNERVLQEIKRKQGITEGLYLYLLQKREESAIAGTASNVAHYKQIDKATGYGPVEPNTRNIILYTTLLGIALAGGIIYVVDSLNDKVRTKQEVTKLLSLPVIGEINRVAKFKEAIISTVGRTIVSEQFRAIRTNLSFLLRDETEKTILITSSVSNEGKSFISLNLAAVLAVTGKKVALVEFDIRNPGVAAKLSLNGSIGLTDYLTDNVTAFSSLRLSNDSLPTLHIFPGGSLAINPGDLLLSKKMIQLFAELKQEYDYIIIDSPPARLVSDAFLLGKFSDLTLYVVRPGFTGKKELEFIQETVRSKTFDNLAIILNDVKGTKNSDYYYTSNQ